ncbi:MAG: c-type cytochrome, partial [Polyangiales bacterium]
TLAFDPQNSSDTESGGVPTYLGPLVVSPTGEHAAIPALQANVDQGVWRSGDPLTFETTVRAVARFVDPETGVEDFAARKQFDNRGFAAAAAQSNRGDYLYFMMRGSRAVDRLDTFGNVQSGTLLDVGFAPQGVAVSSDDRFLFVDAYLSRNLVAYDLSTFSSGMAPIARLPTASAEPLPPEVLRGKQLFNDAFDPRLAKDGYIACAHCHLDGMEDHRVWDFTGRGEGLRNTISLLGRAGLGDGPLHWSANFDEIHDFEHDIRDAFEGTGLMADADFFSGTRSDPLGDPKAGLSADLDALAAYVSSLDEPLPSPFRAPDGSLTPEAEAGKAMFDALDCGSCHAGPRLTDSELVAPGTPLLHDVGTLRPSSGGRLGEPLEGIDTPTLHGLWHTAPYLHDGSAPTLRDVLEAGAPDDPHHVTDDLDPTEVDQLIAYLKSLDGRVD